MIKIMIKQYNKVSILSVQYNVQNLNRRPYI